MVIEVNKINRKESDTLEKALQKDGKALEKHPYVDRNSANTSF